MRNKTSPIPFPAKVPFVDSLGIELHAFGDGQAELRIDLDAAHLNTWHVAHGGVVMTMLDVAMAMAAQSPLGRLGDDDDLKGAALLFASAAGKHITGQILVVDGGVSCVIGH